MRRGKIMNSCNCCGSLCVACTNDRGPAAGCAVTMADSRGRIVYSAETDGFGCATLPVLYADQYCVRVKSTPCSSPAAQSRWLHLSPLNHSKCFFVFHRLICLHGTGALKILLRDTNYPEYPLTGAEYNLYYAGPIT